MATKYPTTGPKPPVDTGYDPPPRQPGLGGSQPAPDIRESRGFTPSGGLGGAVSPWATPGAGGYTIGAERPPDTFPVMRHDDPRGGFGGVPGSGPATASQIGLGTTGGLQSLFGGVSAPAPAPAGNWIGARPGGGLGGPMGTPGLGSINGGGLGASGGGNWQQANGGTQQGMGYGLEPSGPGGFGPGSSIGGAFAAPAPRIGIQLGNRGAQKRMGRTQLGTAPSESGLGEAPGGSSAPAAAPSMPGITGDPGPSGVGTGLARGGPYGGVPWSGPAAGTGVASGLSAGGGMGASGGGLQSLLARARQISPWAKGF